MERMSQEDEGAAYRIEELTRMKNLSEEVAEHINARYQDLNNAYQEQRAQAQQVLGNVYSSAKDEIQALRENLSESNRRLQQEEVAVRHAVETQHQTFLRRREMVSEMHDSLNKLSEETAQALYIA